MPKTLNLEVNLRRRNLIEVESQRAIYGRDSVIRCTLRRKSRITTARSGQHNRQCRPPLHDAGDALLSSDPTQPSVTHSTSPHTPTKEERKTMTTATSWQHNLQCHPPLHDPRSQPPLYDPEGGPGDEPGDPLLHGDLTPAAVELWSRHLSFLRACLHDTLGGALSWRHHLSV
jgi:hypothetical protein